MLQLLGSLNSQTYDTQKYSTHNTRLRRTDFFDSPAEIITDEHQSVDIFKDDDLLVLELGKVVCVHLQAVCALKPFATVRS